MTSKALNAIRLQSYDLNISSIVEENPGWSQRMVNDYFSKQSNINALANLSDNDADQIIENTEDIAQNTIDIQLNTDEIVINAAAIVVVQGNLNDHEANDSAHGVAGDNVGTNNFCSLLVGGVVLLSAAVPYATESTVNVGNPDATDLATVINLANELKQDVNQLVGDVNGAINTLNDFIQKNRDAKQLAT